MRKLGRWLVGWWENTTIGTVVIAATAVVSEGLVRWWSRDESSDK